MVEIFRDNRATRVSLLTRENLSLIYRCIILTENVYVCIYIYARVCVYSYIQANYKSASRQISTAARLTKTNVHLFTGQNFISKSH